MAEEKKTETVVIDKLTPEQEAMIPVIKQKYLDFVFHRKVSFWTPEQQAKKTEDVNWLYGLANLPAPKYGVKFVKSPLEAQRMANLMMEFGEEGWEDKKWPKGKTPQFFSFAYYGNYSDLCWVAHFDFFTQIGVINHADFNRYRDFLIEDGGIYDMLQFDTVCIVIEAPVEINRKDILPHGESRPAIAFEDGYSLYFWNGVNVPEQLIMRPETLTKKDLMNVTNAEQRRCYMEKLGAKTFFEILGGEVEVTDQQIDSAGNLMKLYTTKEPDSIIRERLQFIEVMCPSTFRVYTLYPPKKNGGGFYDKVTDAKAATFSHEGITLRHGDVGLAIVGAPNSLDLES